MNKDLNRLQRYQTKNEARAVCGQRAPGIVLAGAGPQEDPKHPVQRPLCQ